QLDAVAAGEGGQWKGEGDEEKGAHGNGVKMHNGGQRTQRSKTVARGQKRLTDPSRHIIIVVGSARNPSTVDSLMPSLLERLASLFGASPRPAPTAPTPGPRTRLYLYRSEWCVYCRRVAAAMRAL